MCVCIHHISLYAEQKVVSLCLFLQCLNKGYFILVFLDLLLSLNIGWNIHPFYHMGLEFIHFSCNITCNSVNIQLLFGLFSVFYYYEQVLLWTFLPFFVCVCTCANFSLICPGRNYWFIRYVNIQFYKTMPVPTPLCSAPRACASTLCSFSLLFLSIVVLICISQVAKEVYYLFRCWLPTCIIFPAKYLCNAHFPLDYLSFS